MTKTDFKVGQKVRITERLSSRTDDPLSVGVTGEMIRMSETTGKTYVIKETRMKDGHPIVYVNGYWFDPRWLGYLYNSLEELNKALQDGEISDESYLSELVRMGTPSQ